MSQDSVSRRDGSIAVKLKEKKSAYDKYSNYIDSEVSFEPQQSFIDALYEGAFGKSEQKLDFEDQVESFFQSQARKHTDYRHGKLGADHVQAVLDTVDGAMYTGPLYMGRFTPMDVAFDTGSDWLVVDTESCPTCDGNKYNQFASGAQIGEGQSDRVYGSARVTGVEFKDEICLLLSSCVKDFSYFAVYNQVGIYEPVDGIFGLARGGENFHMGGYTVPPHTTYPTAMVDQDLINEKKFSFYLSKKGSSYVDFGKPQTNAMKSSRDIRYIKLLDDYYWSQYNQAVAIGQLDNAFNYENITYSHESNHELYTVFDTGTTAINFSALYFDSFVEAIFAYIGGDDYQVVRGHVVSKCYANFPTLYFMFDNKWVEVDPSDYVKDISAAGDFSECILLVIASQMPFHIIGLPLFQDYYTVHDMEAGQLGFAPHNESQKKRVQNGYAGDIQKKLSAHGKSSQSASVVPYVIMALLSASVSILFYYAIFPGMLDCCSDWVVFLMSGVYFGSAAILFYFWIEPALIKVFSKSGRFIKHGDAHAMTNIMNTAFFTVLITVYYFVMSAHFASRKATKKAPKVEVKLEKSTDDQLVKLLEELKAKNATNQLI